MLSSNKEEEEKFPIDKEEKSCYFMLFELKLKRSL